jgi:hypothetical protein
MIYPKPTMSAAFGGGCGPRRINPHQTLRSWWGLQQRYVTQIELHGAMIHAKISIKKRDET